jgi:signal peptidase I
VTEPPAAAPSRRRRLSRLAELPVLVVVAFGLALLLKTFVVQAFFIPSGSMEQTLHGCPGCRPDRVLVNKLLYDVRDIRRGEIVVFDGEGSFGRNAEVGVAEPGGPVQRAWRAVAGAAGLAPTGEDDFVKRVIGVGGDRVACCSNGRVTVQPAGAARPVELDEPYLYRDDAQPFCAAGTGEQLCPPGSPGVLVPEGRLWVMGDHRSGSSDSRAHIDGPGNGTVPEDRVIGRAFAIVWPPSRARLLEVPEPFAAP